MKKKIILLLFLIQSIVHSQTFKVNYLNSFLYLSGVGLIDLSNNYYDRKFVDNISENELENLSKTSIPFFDKIAINSYSKKLKKWSDYSVYLTLASSTILVYDDNDFKDNLIVFGEILLTQSAICKWTKTFSRRFRPFVYDEDISQDMKKRRNARHSFYSMHSSTAFAAATFGYYYYQNNYGNNLYMALFLFSSASLTSYLRVKSENHFPSDVIVGAIAGSSISYLICKKQSSNRIKIGLSPSNLKLTFYF
ncbi:MAG: hypothetical protein DRZ79_05935 [Candidatus Cloacimonadota bacterium]|nr:MAG: hypothetical protein DRZ79_05935 [Candidatus Cloacimonadota bacterium]